ncbi:glycoside hydrolase family 1 protein [Erysipelothrix tonsillarum]|uniref:glycoside hydrolase family 1 protein n=1 Tax=Erysipelothrix tonsillarum TaxID=38402 RepID=UPI0003700BE9|nr:glycoside hydrolase family 1 protein [Erysipelothrix tonsillarum]
MKQYNFPKTFLWGAASSAPQTEGVYRGDGKSPSTWDQWHEQDPERFYDEVGPNRASSVYEHYKEDIQLMKDMGLNSYRTSISWTRLLPDGKHLNMQAVEYYRDYFQTLIDHDIKPIINLFHFDMPWWMMNKGGWANKEIVDHFEYYARVCVQEFGDLIDCWTTFNEPIVHVECSYMYGFHYPAIVDFKKATLAAYHTMLAHSAAIKAMKAVKADIEVGVILNITPIYAKSNAPEDLEAARIADLLNVYSFLDAMVMGTFKQELVEVLRENELLCETTEDELAMIKTYTASFLGVNYYQPKRVQAPKVQTHKPALTPEDLYIPYEMEGRRINPYRGWEIFPEALYDIAKRLQEDYHEIPWYVSENGIGVQDEQRFKNADGKIEDQYRIEFIQEHLKWLQKAIDEGANCFGYHAWTFVDCWSWLNAYKNRYGFISLDLKTQERTRKESSYWFESFIKEQMK